MAKFYQSRNFGWGINNHDAEHQMADPYSVIAKDVVVGDGFVQSRGGFELWNEDNTKTGGITAMRSVYFRNGNKFLLFANEDHWYTLPNTATTATAWTDRGDYGTAVTNPFAFVHKNAAVLGTGLAANTQNRWAGGANIVATTVQADAASDLRFYEYHQGQNAAFLFGAGNNRDNTTNNNSTLYWTPDNDAWNAAGSGTILIGDGDGTSITGIASHSNILVYKDSSKYRLDIVYESNTGTHVLRVLERFGDGGAINHECIVKALNDVVALSGRLGDGVRGFSQVQTNLGGSESKRYSSKVTPLFDLINRRVAKQTIRAIVWDEKIFIAAPLNGSATNNVVFVGHLTETTDINEPAWTIWQIAAGSFEILVDSDGQEHLMIGDANSPKIYKWNPNVLTDNGQNINAKWRGKKLDMADIGIDDFETIVLAGEMTTPTEIVAKVYIDGNQTQYRITDDQVLTQGNMVWSHVVGSEIVGGNSSGNGFEKKRWIALLPIPDGLRSGSEIQIELASSGKGFFWKLDYLRIMSQEDSGLNLNLFPDRHWVDIE